jgi:DNA-binding phage protein
MMDVSLAAGLSANYLTKVLTEGNDPRISNLAAVCAVLGMAVKVDGHEISFEQTQQTLKKEPTPENWRERLLMVLEEVSTNLKEGKDPTISSLAAICAALGAAISYLAEGYETALGSQQLLNAWKNMPKDKQEALLFLLPTFTR